MGVLRDSDVESLLKEPDNKRVERLLAFKEQGSEPLFEIEKRFSESLAALAAAGARIELEVSRNPVHKDFNEVQLNTSFGAVRVTYGVHDVTHLFGPAGADCRLAVYRPWFIGIGKITFQTEVAIRAGGAVFWRGQCFGWYGTGWESELQAWTFQISAPGTAQPAPPPPWDQMPGAAIDIGISSNGTVWVVGLNPVFGGRGIFKWTGTDWTAVPGGALNIAAEPSGNPWVTNDTGLIFRGDQSGNWAQLPGIARDIGISADGSVWVVGAIPMFGGFSIHRWNGTDWVHIDGGAERIAVDPGGNPWVVNNQNQIFQRHPSGQWTQLPGSAIDIGIGADGSVFVIGTDTRGEGRGIYRWNGSGWSNIEGAAVRVSVDPAGRPWVTNAQGGIFRLR